MFGQRDVKALLSGNTKKGKFSSSVFCMVEGSIKLNALSPQAWYIFLLDPDSDQNPFARNRIFCDKYKQKNIKLFPLPFVNPKARFVNLKKMFIHFLALGLPSSRQGEFHPKPLTEPYVTVSRHTALLDDFLFISLFIQRF